MERPTKTITTSAGHTVVLNEYITGMEQREIRNVLLKGIEIGKLSQIEDPSIKGFSATALSDAQDLAIKFVVVSIDGQTQDVVKHVLDLPASESQEIISAIEEVTSDKKK